MKIKQLFIGAVLAFSFTAATAQTAIPSGYTKGSIVLADGNTINGYVKDNMKKSASVSFIDEANKAKTYNGIDINGATVNGNTYICLKGDFFRSISTGKLNFLQKASDASNVATYNGTEVMFNNGTAGKVGDYFVYSNKELKLLNKKTVAAFIDNDLAGNTAAIEKAKSANGDIAKLKEAVDIYNSTN